MGGLGVRWVIKAPFLAFWFASVISIWRKIWKKSLRNFFALSFSVYSDFALLFSHWKYIGKTVNFDDFRENGERSLKTCCLSDYPSQKNQKRILVKKCLLYLLSFSQKYKVNTTHQERCVHFKSLIWIMMIMMMWHMK